MRIIIETDEGRQPSIQRESDSGAEEAASGARPEERAPTAAAPSEELAARAAAMDASSAGPAPAEVSADGPSLFVGDPSAPKTGPTRAHDVSAGAAPSFAAGVLEVERVEADSSAGAAPEQAREEEPGGVAREAGGGEADPDEEPAAGREDG